jgi:glycosyltransferase involved in cell wall biosynthesis
VREVKRRVVLLTEIIAPYRIPVFNELAKCAEIDLEVMFLAENDPSLRQWEIYKNEIAFHYQVLPSWRKRLGKHNILLNSGLSAALEKARPDVIICGGYNYLASWQSLFWTRQRKVPFIAWVESNARDHRSGDPATEFLKRKFLRSCAAVIVPGKSSFQYVRGYLVPEDVIFTAPNAVDTELFAQGADTARQNAASRREELGLPPRFFVYVGRLVREKGVFELLQAYGTLSPDLQAQVGLVFVGDGAARASLSQNAPTGVQFKGFAQRDQLSNYYGLADAFVFPTHSDPWGLVVNEAMACGLPIIASNAAGCVADLVTDGWNGRVVAPQRTEELASAMTELARDSEIRATMGKRSRERISAFSPQACAAGIAAAVIFTSGARHE